MPARPYLQQFAASTAGRAALEGELDAMAERIADLESQVAELVALVTAQRPGGGFQPVGEAWDDGTWFVDPDGRRWGWIAAG